jgi:hypothetical protein
VRTAAAIERESQVLRKAATMLNGL